ncbi:hypothetical protein PVAG01_05302 [Phlyctema vagabunda]|uniref:Uncharacterized protein n=1 Tax=Phlyctema vagabunda TaxID=108571 RepID=A0ABR4PJP9_9HELO
MENLEPLPDAIKHIQRSLEPYIKQRQDINSIRRVLTAHLGQHVDPKAQNKWTIARPLPLSDHTETIEASSSGLKGTRKELLRCLRSNAKARSDYVKISKQHQPDSINEKQHLHDGRESRQDKADFSKSSLDSFLELVKQRRKHERLRIVQDYIDVLSQKPAAASDFLEPYQLLNSSDQSSPSVPPELINGVKSGSQPASMDLNDLVEQLEKSVLRAKLLLKREQKLLIKLRADTQASSDNPSSVSKGDKLHALGTTRNELINWIETELARAGDSPEAGDDEIQRANSKTKGKEYVDHQLALTGRQYGHYMKARQALILAAAGQNVVSPPESSVEVEDDMNEEVAEKRSTTNIITSQFIDKLLAVSNDQKSTIQQKSHLTISMAKQLKDSSQGLDRLAHESHLLPTYPMPSTSQQSKGSEGTSSFEAQLTRHEKPDHSRKARAWVFAADAASHSTNDVILQRLEDGEASISQAVQTLSDLRTLLGEAEGEEREEKHGVDMWARLDGRLGSIKNEDV